MQAQCTIQALLVEIDGDEANCFAKFLAYIKCYKAADRFNYAQLKLSERGNFEAVFFALAGCAKACSQLRKFIAVDGTHTRSKYQIQLLIATRINANNNKVLLAQALVLIKDKYQQTQFFKHFYIAHPPTQRESQIFISDREKGIALALEKVYSLAFYVYCCQHIADNVQTKFSNTC